MFNTKRFDGRLTSFHLDVLKEVGNVGAGHAATSLSKLLGRKVDMHVPDVQVVDFDEVMELAGGAEREMVSIFLRIEGDAPGSMFFILPPQQANRFVALLTGVTNFGESHEEDAELASSALQELGNILSGSYLTALSDFTDLYLYPSVPSLSRDMVGAILSTGLIEASQVSDHAIVIETSLSDGDAQTDVMEGHFFLFPDPDSYSEIFHSLGVPGHE
ncbi:chemotaxis protein CheC [Halobacillus sp. H74]|uniref:chemotaxis protein CheC n=1 Tax=Halobacillus sp. H74 TaxID=3457436 RepID=UPI003FCE26DF